MSFERQDVQSHKGERFSILYRLVLETTKLVLGFSHQKRVVSQPRPLLRANEVREGHTATSDWKIRAGEGSI